MTIDHCDIRVYASAFRRSQRGHRRQLSSTV